MGMLGEVELTEHLRDGMRRALNSGKFPVVQNNGSTVPERNPVLAQK